MRLEEVQYDLIVVGGGAAGFFAAIETARRNTLMRILMLEKSNKLLSKVKISGGGRCNVTHNCFNPIELAKHYPRGGKKLKSLFKKFNAEDMVKWLRLRGIEVHTEEDGRMFPVSNDSQTIIDSFLKQALHYKIKIELSTGVTHITKRDNLFSLETNSLVTYQAKLVLVAIGGSPRAESYNWIADLGHTIKKPVPSLFTFNDPEKRFTDLMGLSVRNATVRIAGTKYSQAGPVLITHWGLSGPAIIKLSAWAAEFLHEQNYQYTVLVNWTGARTEDELRTEFEEYRHARGRQKVRANPLYALPLRLWERFCLLSEITDEKIWADIPKRNMNRLIENLIRCQFNMRGKTTFKEEFVTCGGVDLDEINMETMESRIVKNLYFAGEVTHIDGETGGFNFQAAWTTGFVAANAITEKNGGEIDRHHPTSNPLNS